MEICVEVAPSPQGLWWHGHKTIRFLGRATKPRLKTRCDKDGETSATGSENPVPPVWVEVRWDASKRRPHDVIEVLVSEVSMT
jgi:hypothetical protein